MTKFAKGMILGVYRGRKVPIGTVGVCIYAAEGRYGERVGIKDKSGAVQWTSASNCSEIDECEAPAWITLEREAFAATRAMRAATEAVVALPAVDTVVTLVSGVVGKVFWAGTTRYGAKRIGVKTKSTGETVWASVTEIAA